MAHQEAENRCRLDGSGIIKVDPCQENYSPACENSLQACRRPAVSDSEGNGARASAAGRYSPEGGRQSTSGVYPSQWARGATVGLADSDGKRGPADTGWNAAQPSCGMAAGRRQRTIIGGTLKVIYGVRSGTMCSAVATGSATRTATPQHSHSHSTATAQHSTASHRITAYPVNYLQATPNFRPFSASRGHAARRLSDVPAGVGGASFAVAARQASHRFSCPP